MATTGTTRRAPIWLLFLGAGLVWGASFLFIKVALTGMNPAQIAATRLGLGALALGAAMLVTRTRPIRDPKLLLHIAVTGFFLAGLPLMIWGWAGMSLPSGVLAIFNATTPLLTLIVASVVLPGERLSRFAVVGVVLGAVGLIVVVGPWRGLVSTGHGPEVVIAYLACLLATSCYAIGFVYLRKVLRGARYDPLAFTFAQISAGFVLVLLMSLPFGLAAPVSLSPQLVWSIVLLGAFGTGLAYVWNNQVISAWGSVRASMVTYLTPVVGVVLGVSILGESFSWNEPVGLVVLLLGIAMAQGLIRPGRATAQAS